MNKLVKRVLTCVLILVLIVIGAFGYYLIRRGPRVAIFGDYGVYFKDYPFLLSVKTHMDLGEPVKLEEQDETLYKVETDMFGVAGTLSLSFIGGRQLSNVYLQIPMNDPAEIMRTFQELSDMIESAYENHAELSKGEIEHNGESEYKLRMSYKVSGATSVSYNISASSAGLTVSCSYNW